MKNKCLCVILSILFSNTICSQAIIDTESSLKKIDSTFHVFADFMGDQKTGNFKFNFLRSDITLGSRIKNDLFRITFSYSSSKLNGNNFDKKINFQFRWNKILNEDIGLRQHIYKKDKNYFDIAVGPFYELESYPEYKFENINFDGFSQKTTRISFNIFSSVKLFENITSATTLYSQWKYNEIRDVRVFANQYIRFKINEKISTYIKYVVSYRSINYVKSLKNDTDFMYGFEINI